MEKESQHKAEGSSTPSPISHLPSSILIRGVNWLGDAVMTTPALQRLRERFPKARLTLLTPEKLLGLWQNHPSLDSVLSFAPGESPWSIAQRLRSENLELALVLPNSPRSALEVWLARIPQRVGYARPWRNWSLTQTIPNRPERVKMRKRPVAEIKRLAQSQPHQASGLDANEAPRPLVHQIHEYLELTAALGANPDPIAPLIHVTNEELRSVAAQFNLDRELSQTPLFGLNPGAEYGPAKRWPLEQFIAAAIEIQRRTKCRWLIFGGAADRESADKIATSLCAASGSHVALDLAAKTTLRELCALLKLCRVVLTNDTGPMHLAAAVGTPVVVPFGSTSRELTAPGLPGDSRHALLCANVPCSPCFRRVCPIDLRCLTGVSVQTVVAAVMQISTQQ